MTKLTEDMVIARTKTSDLSTVKKFNCWGSDLDDVSLVRRLVNVEVLSLSLNKITSLQDFQHCRNLTELYVRRNEIRDLCELCYLQELPKLKRLLLSENPGVESAGALYRATVLRCLPNLEVLDNQAVGSDEVEAAMKSGLILEHPLQRRERPPSPDPPVYYDRESPPPVMQQNRRSANHYEYEDDSPPPYRHGSSHSPDYHYHQNRRQSGSPVIDYYHNGRDRDSNGSVSRRQSVDYSGENMRNYENYYDDQLSHRTATVQVIPTQRHPPLPPSQLRAKPRTKTSNLLSAVLCLLPELDWGSLEVIEMAVRRRMDEIINS